MSAFAGGNIVRVPQKNFQWSTKMNTQPELRGHTVRLRPLVEKDRAALTKAGSDPKIWAQHPDTDRHRPERFALFFDDALASGGALIIEEIPSGRVIGSSRYHNLDIDNGRIEIGWTFLTRDHWGKGTNREVKDLMLGHAFKFVPIVRFKIGAHNHRSRRAVEKIGGRLTKGIGKPENDSVIYEIDRSSFVE